LAGARDNREAERPEWERSNIGLMLFTSLMIILLAFFIMLSSMAVIDEQRQIKAMDSVLGAFGLMPGGAAVTGGRASVSPEASPLTDIKNDMALLRDSLAGRMGEGQVRFLKGQNRRIISLTAGMLFKPDSAELKPEFEGALTQIADAVRDAAYPIVIEGHTDNTAPMTEAYEDNWVLSALRATAVFRFLAEQGGLDPVRLAAYGYGDTQPVYPNDTPKHRARNNRVDLVLDARNQAWADRLEDKYRPRKLFNFQGFDFKLFKGDE
jgi:chemotaxis protein MotB